MKIVLNGVQDPIMTQFPLILAIEPKLLPPAVANGFRMDYKVLTVVVASPRSRLTARVVQGLCLSEDV